MNKYCLYFSIYILLNMSISCNRNALFTKTEAEQLMKDYVAELAHCDSCRIAPFWSRYSREQYGFQWMLVSIANPLSFEDYCRFVQVYDFEMTDVEEEDGYSVLRYNWIEKETKSGDEPKSHKMISYVIRENGRWVFAQSREIFTKDWQIYESDCFIYHIPPELDINRHFEEIQFLDEQCRAITKRLGIRLNKKYHYYKVRSAGECARVMTVGAYQGVAVQVLNLLVSTRFCHVHELVHLLDREVGFTADESGRYNPIFSEGFAVAFGGVSGTSAGFADIESKNLLDNPKYVPLSTLLTHPGDFVRDNFITYFEMGSFLKTIYNTYGLEKLRDVCRITSHDPEVIERIEGILGKSITEIENQWHISLGQMDVPCVGTVIPQDAEFIFSVLDAEGDDSGDGDYIYPNDRFQAGVFDLTGFEIFRDDGRIYFRLTFLNMTRPVQYGSGEAFLPGCVIAIQKGKRDGGFLQNACHGIRFMRGEGFDIKINVGTSVSISDRFNRVVFSSPEMIDEISDLNEKTLSFSIPIETIGEPREVWKYFVGVGLMSNRSMNFLYGGPEPVRKDHPVFIRGGNFEQGNPAFIDLLLPEGTDQVRILNDYDGDKGKLVVVPMVGGKSSSSLERE